jgi:photosystem II stability/assembly factor-like uncharacterized protein
MRLQLMGGLLAGFILGASTHVFAANDLAVEPAMKSTKAAHSKLMDVTSTGDRFVVVGEKGHILYSDDQGQSWDQADVPVSVTLTSVAFASPDNGWAVGHEGIVLHSSDKGATWTKKFDGVWVISKSYKGCEKLVEKYANRLQNASDDERFYIEEKNQIAGFYLEDMEAFATEKVSKPIMSINFSSESEGMMVGGLGIAFRTEDGGVTWASQIDRIGNVDGYNFYDVMIGDSTTYVVGEAGGLFRSNNDGGDWQKMEIPYEGSLYSLLSTADNQCVLVVGFGGNVLRSCDAGETWNLQQLTENRKALFGGITLKDGSLLLYGIEAAVLFSSDKGETYQKAVTGFPAVMSAAETDDGHVILVGLAGVKRISLQDIRK